MIKECELLAESRKLAKKRGLDVAQVDCPVKTVCEGSVCIYIADSVPSDASEQEETQVDKFFNKLRKHKSLKN